MLYKIHFPCVLNRIFLHVVEYGCVGIGYPLAPQRNVVEVAELGRNRVMLYVELFLLFAGGILGWYGLPIQPPWASYWTWMTPSGFRYLSVVALAAVGLLLGLFIDLLLRCLRQEAEEWWVWFTGISALCILTGVISVYRSASMDDYGLWSMGAGNAIIHLDDVNQQGYAKKSTWSETDLDQVQSLAKASAIGLMATGSYYERRGFRHMNEVGYGLAHAANDLMDTKEPAIQEKAKEFILLAGDVAGQMMHATGKYDMPTVQRIVDGIYAKEPDDYKAVYSW